MGLQRIAAHVVTLGVFLGILVAPSSAEGVFDVAVENAKPGSRGWTISKQQFTLKTLAFADRASVLPGESFGLYVECAASMFTVRAYRIGDYAGAGARRVWSSEDIPCERQPAAKFDLSTNTASAPWRRTLEVTTTDWPEGMYLLRVTADDGSATFVDMVVRSTSAEGRVLLISATHTFQAYNQWGGANAYRGKRGFSTRARVVTYDRPQTWGLGSGKFLGYESPLVRRAEALGLPLAYAADVDINNEPSLVDGALSLVFGGHTEYWTQVERDAVMNARSNGTNLLFFGANSAYWRVRLEESSLGPDRRMAVYKIRKQDPNKQEATIRFRDVGQPDSALTGVTYTCFPVRGEFTITNASSWVFDGLDVRNGQTFSGIVGPEVDKLMSKTKYDDVLANSPATCGKKTPTHSTMLLRRDPSGAATFAVGTMGWVLKALKGDAPQASVDLVRTVTDNVLRASTTKGLAPS